MKIRFFLALFLCTLNVHYDAFANTQVEQRVKEQQKNDGNILNENRVEKKVVFSNILLPSDYNIELPHEAECFLLNELVVRHDFLKNEEIKNIKKYISGKCLGVEGIERVAIVVQDVYINSGYVTTRVDTPYQDLSSGKLIVSVTPGVIENVIIRSGDISDCILPFGRGDVLNIRDIEQGFENLQKTPGVDVKINIEPGQHAGYSNIVIDTHRTKKWNARLSYNNWGDESTGRTLAGGVGYLYNVAGMSDLLYVAGTSSTTGAYKSISTYYSFPVGFWDYEFLYSNSKSHQAIDIGYMNLDYLGKSEYLSVKGSRTIYRDMDKKITSSAEILRRKSAYTLGGVELAMQERDLGNLRFALNYKQNFQDASLNSTLSWQRFLTWFGGEKTPDMLYGDVSTESEVVGLDINYLKWLSFSPFQMYYDFQLGAQFSQDILTLQDRFTIGSRWSVRGFENSTGLDGNKGIFIRNTLNVITGLKDTSLYIGADYGQVFGDVYPQNIHSSKKLIGAITGIKGGWESLEYDFSVSTPVLYPSNLAVDDFIMSMNVAYHL